MIDITGFKKGQVTVFVIIAILIVAAVGIYFLVRNTTSSSGVPAEFKGVYDDFIFCLQNKLSLGISVLESKGGYINVPSFVSGSEFMPFSSQLDFLGNPVPYWYYVSGNNVPKENVPAKSNMESELASFVNNNVNDCIPENFGDETQLDAGAPNAQISIKSNEVALNLNMDFDLKRNETSTRITSHKITVKTDLGVLYDNALKVYNQEQKELFLENYTIDILNLYAPVDGVEISCSPKIWDATAVFEDLQNAVQDNIQTLKTSGQSDDYFVVKGLRNQISNGIYVKFLNSKNWSSTLQVNPSEGPLLKADPVGNQQGMGILGFCYVPYHFVYDLKYPVMVQVYSEDTGEVFQFPVAVIIQGNNPRNPLTGNASVSTESSDICSTKDSEIMVSVVDRNSNSVNSEISYECFDQNCFIGNSVDGVLEGMFPKCVNGYIIARAEGYKDSQLEFTSVSSGSIQIVLDKIYEKDVLLNLDSQVYNGKATITFTSSDGETQTILYPEQKKVSLSEGTYNIAVSVYSNISLNLGSSTQQYCTEVPRGFLGIIGLTKKECYDIQIPEQLISSALSGGGTLDNYGVYENSLRGTGKIIINAEKFPTPNSLNQIQENNILFESKSLEVSLI